MITAVFSTMALQLIEIFQCSLTYSMKQTSLFFYCCNAFIDFIVCDCSLRINEQLTRVYCFKLIKKLKKKNNNKNQLNKIYYLKKII